MPWRKSHPNPPAGYFAWEAAGLGWLAQVADGAPVVSVLQVYPDQLVLERLTETVPTAAAARRFGAALARTHAAGAPAFGAPPAGWTGDGFFGPLASPLPLRLTPCAHWSEHLAVNLLGPITRACRDAAVFDSAAAAVLDRVAARADRWDTGTPPARLHGDLWSGNLLWTPAGATLIDPAAHGGHPEADLAMLALFGAPHLGELLAAYRQQQALTSEWEQRVGIHQLYPLAVHALLLRGSYAAHTLQVARRYA